MTIKESIERFPEQFAFEPVIENQEAFKRKSRFLVLGVGGSQWPANLIKAWDETLQIRQWRDYELPSLSESDLHDHLVVAVSHSGNTEETISAYEGALDRGLATVAVAVGGKLLAMAQEQRQPYIQLPDIGLQPRAATGLIVKAMLKAFGADRGLEEVSSLASSLSPTDCEPKGKELATQCEGSVPIIYAARRNGAVAMVWKIKLNETGKIPAFFHVFPELNHNEMTGFDVVERTRSLSQNFRWIFLADSEDDPRVQKRMEIAQQLFSDRGLSITKVEFDGLIRWHRIFASLLTADWFALHTAEQYGVEATEVLMVEEFKKLMAS